MRVARGGIGAPDKQGRPAFSKKNSLPFLFPLLLATAHAAPPVQDPDWPCVQRLVPSLAAGTYWTGPAPDADWRADPEVAALVAGIAPRNVPDDVALARLDAFAGALPPEGKPARLAALFAGLVDATNHERDQVIERLHALTRRQREINGLVSAVSTDLAHEADPAKRDEMTQRRLFLIREFDQAQQTVRYACEAPVQLEARLGAFGRALDGDL